jgi:hypothetical protein
MLTFDQFLRDTARKGEVANTLFEQRLFDLVGTLQKITEPLENSGIAHELIGGLAVFLHVENRDPAHSVLTRDVDLMIHRSDLPRMIQVAQDHGFRFRHAAGLDMLLYGNVTSAKDAVHILFSGEKVKDSQAEPNPELQAVRMKMHGRDFWVIPLTDLVRMKLSSFRLKDQVHIKSMDAAGLITPDVEQSLSQVLHSRLRHTRETE